MSYLSRRAPDKTRQFGNITVDVWIRDDGIDFFVMFRLRAEYLDNNKKVKSTYCFKRGEIPYIQQIFEWLYKMEPSGISQV